jgi:hypothetical protein
MGVHIYISIWGDWKMNSGPASHPPPVSITYSELNWYMKTLSRPLVNQDQRQTDESSDAEAV